MSGTVVSSRDFHRLMRFLAADEEDEPAAASVADDLDDHEQAREYIESLTKVDLNAYDLRRLRREAEEDVRLLRNLYERTEPLAAADAKLARLKELLATDL